MQVSSEVFSKQVAETLRVLTGIVRLQKGPQDLPYSVPILLLLIGISIILDAMTQAVLPLPEKVEVGNKGPVLVGIDLAVTLLWHAGLLRVAGKSERLTQTLAAVFGFQIILAPVLLFTAWFFATYSQDASWMLPSRLLVLVVTIWLLVILARILNAATQWPLFACAMLAITYRLLAELLLYSVIAPPATAT